MKRYIEHLTARLTKRLSADDARRTAQAFIAQLVTGSRADAAHVLERIGISRTTARGMAERILEKLSEDPAVAAYDLAAGQGERPQWPATEKVTFAQTAVIRKGNSTPAECGAIHSQRRYDKLIGVQDIELDCREMAIARMAEDGADVDLDTLLRTARIYRRNAGDMDAFKRLTQRHAARLRYRILSQECANHEQTTCDCAARAAAFASSLNLPWWTLYMHRNGKFPDADGLRRHLL